MTLVGMGLLSKFGVVAVSALTLAGCAAASPAADSQTGPPTTPSAASESQQALSSGARLDPIVYDCNGHSIEATDYAGRVPVDQSGADFVLQLTSIVEDLGYQQDFRDFSAWFVIERSDDMITLIRETESFDASGDHDVMSFGREGSANWMLVSATTCPLSLDVAPLGIADLMLDPASPPDAESMKLAFLVTERACNSGEDATGRVEVLSVEETDEAVTLHVAVRPRGGDQFCPSNPPTPLTIELREPLGERAVIDGGLAEPKPVRVAPAVTH